MKTARALLLGLTLTAVFAAHAQYQWVDKSGRRVFSDRPPPADVPEKNVLVQPRLSGAAPAAATGSGTPAADTAPAAGTAPASAGAASAPSAPASAGVDSDLEKKKKEAQAAEAAKKKAEQDKLLADRAENCKRAMNAKATLESGTRIVRQNDKGEREVLNDAQRASEMQRLQNIINQDCR